MCAMKNLIYKEIPEYDRATALQEIDSCVTTRVVDALLALAFYEPDWRWVQGLCVEHSRSANENVRGVAILCFGHLARIHRMLDTEMVVPVIINAMADPSNFVRGHSEDALDDILMFCIPDAYQRAAAIEKLGSERIDSILLGLYDIAKNDSDSQFAQAVCIEHSNHPNQIVRGVALRGFAAIVYQHGQIDNGKIIGILTEAAQVNGYAGERARSAIECIEKYLLADDNDL